VFIAKTETRRSKNGTIYYTIRLLTSRQVFRKTRQVVLLNLGARYPIPPELWKEVTDRAEEILSGCPSLFPARPEVEAEAQRIVAALYSKGIYKREDQAKSPLDGYFAEDVEQEDARTVGAEYVALHAIEQLKLPHIFSSLGFDDETIKYVKALIVGRMIHPGSEAATFDWLVNASGLGDLVDVDFSKKSVMALHRAADKINSKIDDIDYLIYNNLPFIGNIDQSVVLYDLTNTYFEGNPNDDDAKRGFSKEKRSDCRLVSLGIMMDGAGFIRRSKIFPGNVSEPKTLEIMLKALNPPQNTLMIMDRGIATADNVALLQKNGYRYLVVNNKRSREFEKGLSTPIETAKGEEVYIYSKLSDNGLENTVYCQSPARTQKEKAMLEPLMAKYESALQNLNKSLAGPRGKKDLASVNLALGRLAERFSGVSQYYTINVLNNNSFKIKNTLTEVFQVDYERKIVFGSKLSHPGVYSIRTNDLRLSPEQVWRKYIQLTELESVFRSLKSELGLRPIYHQKKKRIDSHLFISIIAYQCIHLIRSTLKKQNINDSWQKIVTSLQSHVRVTSVYNKEGKKPIKIRKSTKATFAQLRIYASLGLDHKIGKTTKIQL
jgi:transposase